MAERPPAEISPAQFFEQWLPERFHDEFGPGKRAAADVKARVRLDGDGGGAWDIVISAGAMKVGPPDGGEAPVTVRQSVQDWRAVTVGETGAVDLAPKQASPLDMFFVDPASRQVLTQVRGTVRFEVTGFNGRTWQLTCKFGEQPEPGEANAVISVDAETYGKILARQMAPPEAYFAGKVRLSGDTGLAMQLGMAMMPRFS